MKDGKVAGLSPTDKNRHAVKRGGNVFVFLSLMTCVSSNHSAHTGPERLGRKPLDGEKMGPTS